MRTGRVLLLSLAALIAAPGLATAKRTTAISPAKPNSEAEARLTPAVLRSLLTPTPKLAPQKACTGGRAPAAPFRIV